MASTEDVLRDLWTDLGPMYEEFLGDLQKAGVAGAARDKAGSDTYVTPFDRTGSNVDEEIRHMLEETVRQASQDVNPKTPSLEEFLRQITDGSPADTGDQHSHMTPHERLMYGEDAVKALVTKLMDQNRALAVRTDRQDRALRSAIKAVASLKALAEEKHEHKYDEKGMCGCGSKKAMSAEPSEEERKAAEAAEHEREEREKKEREKDEALATVLTNLSDRLAGIEKGLGIAPTGRSTESGGTPTDTALAGLQGVMGRTFANPSPPDGSPAGLTAKGVSESAIKAFTEEAMARAIEVGKTSPIGSNEMRKEILEARAGWQLSTQPTPPGIENYELRALAEKHGLPIRKFGK